MSPSSESQLTITAAQLDWTASDGRLGWIRVLHGQRVANAMPDSVRLGWVAQVLIPIAGDIDVFIVAGASAGLCANPCRPQHRQRKHAHAPNESAHNPPKTGIAPELHLLPIFVNAAICRRRVLFTARVGDQRGEDFDLPRLCSWSRHQRSHSLSKLPNAS